MINFRWICVPLSIFHIFSRFFSTGGRFTSMYFISQNAIIPLFMKCIIQYPKYWKSPDATRRNQTQLGLIEISLIDYHSDNRWIQFIIVLGITLEYKIRIQCLLACKELNRNKNIKILFTNSEDSNTSIELNVFTPWLFMISWSFWQLRIFSLPPQKRNESNPYFSISLTYVSKIPDIVS